MIWQTTSPSTHIADSFSKYYLFFILPILGLGLACKRPEIQPSASPVQLVEVLVRIKGSTQEDETNFVTQLRSKIDIPVVSPEPITKQSWNPFKALSPASTASNTESEAPTRILQVKISGHQNMYDGAGKTKRYLMSIGYGTLFGSFLGSGAALGQVVFWKGSVIGAGAGAILGVVVAPGEFRRCESLRKELGYLPWDFTLSWRAIDRKSKDSALILATGSETVRVRPLLQYLPEDSRTIDDIRRESIRACIEAVTESLRKKQESLKAGTKISSTRRPPP
jgi:hypothetical protein